MVKKKNTSKKKVKKVNKKTKSVKQRKIKDTTLKAPRKWRFSKKELMITIVMIILYLILGNINSIKSNPVVPGAIVAVNMIVVVIAGILFGKKVGLGTGLAGTFVNAAITGSGFELAAIIPHTIMGWYAGKIANKKRLVISSLAIIVGHILNIIMFLITGLLSISALANSYFWMGLIYGAVFGIISISLICWLYLKIVHKK